MPDYEREKLDVEILLNKAAYGACLLAAQRRACGLTQWDVAKAMGGNWSQPIIANIERGGRRVDLVELLDIADIIGLDVPTLIGRLRSVPR